MDDEDDVEGVEQGGDLVIALYEKVRYLLCTLKQISELTHCGGVQVQRVKNKWKVTLKDGLVSVNGKEYLFAKCQGYVEGFLFVLFCVERMLNLEFVAASSNGERGGERLRRTRDGCIISSSFLSVSFLLSRRRACDCRNADSIRTIRSLLSSIRSLLSSKVALRKFASSLLSFSLFDFRQQLRRLDLCKACQAFRHLHLMEGTSRQEDQRFLSQVSPETTSDRNCSQG